MTEHHHVVVVGGGNAGLSVAGRLRRYGVDDIVVIEPREEHLYAPMFSHIAGGTAAARVAVRPQGQVTPKGVKWVRDSVTTVVPEVDRVVLASGRQLSYDQLIVCPGIQKDWEAIPGLAEAMATPYGMSNYEFDYAIKASDALKAVTAGTVIFTQPAGPATCAGAAQKPMYLACDYWRATGVLSAIRVLLILPDPTPFGIPGIDAELNRKLVEYGIEVRYESRLLEVDPDQRRVLIARQNVPPERLDYDLLHAVPPQSAPDWIKQSPLAGPSPDGFVEVDPKTLRHRRYDNVWALGDVAATTNSKSGGALRKQTVVVAKNLVRVLRGRQPEAHYDGYSVCPFTVSRSSVVLAEFDDRYQLSPTVPFWKTLYRERRLTWIADRHILPWVYWHLILQGRA